MSEQPLPILMSEAEYLALPEEIARTIEVVHGNVILCESPTRGHNKLAKRMADALESARPSQPCIEIDTDVDVVLWRVPKYTFRRPDVTVYRCQPDLTSRLEASDVMMVVEVASPTTVRADLIDKKAQYAAAGIPLYLVIELDDKSEIEQVREFHLDAAAREYRLTTLHGGAEIELEYPFPVTMPVEDLMRR
ncbi:Uma2 family endonuclease [Spirillospora sp. NPDC048911]|uniref:Uma2 family endonuclease n=1 Tax=Spirillospora sp. NPDC048911 TaxID=3364527 RepID=UPI0037197AA8